MGPKLRTADSAERDKRNDALERSARHLIAFAQDEVGLRMKMCDYEREKTGHLDLKRIDDEDRQGFRDVLLSCQVLERLLHLSAPAREYPRLIEAAA